MKRKKRKGERGEWKRGEGYTWSDTLPYTCTCMCYFAWQFRVKPILLAWSSTYHAYMEHIPDFNLSIGVPGQHLLLVARNTVLLDTAATCGEGHTLQELTHCSTHSSLYLSSFFSPFFLLSHSSLSPLPLLPMQCHPKSKYQETEDKLVHHLLPAGYMLTLSLAQNERGKPPPTLNLSCSSQGSTYSMYMHAASIVTWSIVLEFQTQL